MLSDADLVSMDQWAISPEENRRKLGALLTEVRAYRALRSFAEERRDYPEASWGELKLAELVLAVS
jgi:hypothetical protein